MYLAPHFTAGFYCDIRWLRCCCLSFCSSEKMDDYYKSYKDSNYQDAPGFQPSPETPHTNKCCNGGSQSHQYIPGNASAASRHTIAEGSSLVNKDQKGKVCNRQQYGAKRRGRHCQPGCRLLPENGAQSTDRDHQSADALRPARWRPA